MLSSSTSLPGDASEVRRAAHSAWQLHVDHPHPILHSSTPKDTCCKQVPGNSTGFWGRWQLQLQACPWEWNRILGLAAAPALFPLTPGCGWSIPVPGGELALGPRGNGLVFWVLFACLFVFSSTNVPSLGLGFVCFVPCGLGNITEAWKVLKLHPRSASLSSSPGSAFN